ncbi:U1 small nuclear ribonucleoprotein C [Sigmodon hispidus]
MHLTHDSPSVRKTHCNVRKHKENVKDYYQKWMEEQAQSLIDKTTAEFQQGKLPPTPFSAPPPAGAMIPPPPSLSGPPRPGMMPAPHMGGPPMMPMMDPPPPGMMSVRPAPGMSGWPHAHDAGAPNDETSCSSYDGAHLPWHDSARQIRAESLFISLYLLFCFTRR